jgi:cation transport ATPase
MATERFVRTENPRSLIVPLLVLLGILIVFGLVTPGILTSNDGATTPARVAIAVGMLAPISLVMGMPFVIGMRAASARPGAPTAFLWGINGAASVCASVFGVVIAVFFGISTAFWTGAAVYAVAALSMFFISRAQQRSAVDASVEDEMALLPPSAELV